MDFLRNIASRSRVWTFQKLPKRNWWIASQNCYKYNSVYILWSLHIMKSLKSQRFKTSLLLPHVFSYLNILLVIRSTLSNFNVISLNLIFFNFVLVYIYLIYICPFFNFPVPFYL
jgi:hypothetical protein